jgi:hypothetical protein
VAFRRDFYDGVPLPDHARFSVSRSGIFVFGYRVFPEFGQVCYLVPSQASSRMKV